MKMNVIMSMIWASFVFLGMNVACHTQMASVTQENVETILKTDRPVILFFYAVGNSLCQEMKAVVQAEAHCRTEMVFAQVDYEQMKSLAQECGVTHLPALVGVQHNRITGKAYGFFSAQKLHERIHEIVRGVDYATFDQAQLSARLQEALATADAPVVTQLIQAGIDVNHPFADGITPLCKAVSLCTESGKNMVPIIKLLLDAGACVDVEIQKGVSLRMLPHMIMNNLDRLLDVVKRVDQLFDECAQRQVPQEMKG